MSQYILLRHREIPDLNQLEVSRMHGGYQAFQFLEGVAIAAYAVQAQTAYIYLRGEFWKIAESLDHKIADLEAAGLLGDKLFGSDYSLRIYTHLGAGAYICGEETAMLESLEGKLGQPRPRPPFPPSYRL